VHKSTINQVLVVCGLPVLPPSFPFAPSKWVRGRWVGRGAVHTSFVSAHQGDTRLLFGADFFHLRRRGRLLWILMAFLMACCLFCWFGDTREGCHRTDASLRRLHAVTPPHPTHTNANANANPFYSSPSTHAHANTATHAFVRVVMFELNFHVISTHLVHRMDSAVSCRIYLSMLMLFSTRPKRLHRMDSFA
jgi:hypothetical protein